MGTISLTFTGSTIEEVARLVEEWVPPVALAGTSRAGAPASTADDAAAIGRVISGVHGQKSRRLLRYLAEAGLRDVSVKLNEALVHEFGVAGGTAFAGMIGPVNRRAMRIMKRLLIDYPSSDPKARVWRIAPEDAQAVLDALDRAQG